jgi:tetratricopeptide (TPR) repeat protein
MMNGTLNLVDHLLAAASRCQEQGRLREAVRLLTQLASFRELPAVVAEQTQARLAELHLKRRKFKRARRHLAAALQHAPDGAIYHYNMATAFANDRDGDLERAADHYRRSLELNPEQVKCQYEYGLLQVRLGETEEGLGRLRKAVEQAPADADAVAKLTKGLRLAGRTEEAGAALRAALFRNPRGPRFRKLWHEFQFHQLRQRQDMERIRRTASRRHNAPVILPFVRLDPPHTPTEKPLGDEPATVAAPHRLPLTPTPLPKSGERGRGEGARSEQRNVQ